MIVFPNAKINLGLHVLNKRSDGFHNLETVFYPIPFTDVLEIIPGAAGTENDLEFSVSGLAEEELSTDNLCIRAVESVRKKRALPSLQIHLHKAIPLGAGLGGGSADAVFTLKMLNTFLPEELSVSELSELAESLGSDCPFFISNTPSLATGRGEILEPVSLDLSAYRILLVYPGISINTGWAFSQLKLPEQDSERTNLKQVISEPVISWKEKLVNDFEKPVFVKHPEIGEIKNTLYNAGAVYASLSGSGSVVYGLFEKDMTPEFGFPDHYLVRHF